MSVTIPANTSSADFPLNFNFAHLNHNSSNASSTFFYLPPPPPGGLGRMITPLFNQQQMDLFATTVIDWSKLAKFINDISSWLSPSSYFKNEVKVNEKIVWDAQSLAKASMRQEFANTQALVYGASFSSLFISQERKELINQCALNENIEALTLLTDLELKQINLFRIVEENKIKTLEFLLTRNISLLSQLTKITDFGGIAKGANIVHAAARLGKVDVIKLLNEHGILNLNNRKDSQGYLPSHYAIEWGHVNVLEYFDEIKVPHHFDIERPVLDENDNEIPAEVIYERLVLVFQQGTHLTPVQLALSNRKSAKLEMLKYFKSKGIDLQHAVLYAEHCTIEELRWLKEQNLDFTVTDEEGFSLSYFLLHHLAEQYVAEKSTEDKIQYVSKFVSKLQDVIDFSDKSSALITHQKFFEEQTSYIPEQIERINQRRQHPLERSRSYDYIGDGD